MIMKRIYRYFRKSWFQSHTMDRFPEIHRGTEVAGRLPNLAKMSNYEILVMK